jgi:hypothetical protein
MLFNDDKYDAPNALVFDWNPIFWGMGPERFSYNRTTLQEAILKEMERENWIGVCCEPNCVFVSFQLVWPLHMLKTLPVLWCATNFQ